MRSICGKQLVLGQRIGHPVDTPSQRSKSGGVRGPKIELFTALWGRPLPGRPRTCRHDHVHSICQDMYKCMLLFFCIHQAHGHVGLSQSVE
ncbi:hypothetical protein GDO78_006321 [Eleutherodactylus coqui]|uniref:Uncharacterized protein n=1 Tax=Eleutherodactylus coqui TaxID=57060 RepID=A0A8J6FP70_ELECQ|nr:hypothetical protein GDO78_006321 [Eleutherodactylus coqui]